MANFPSMVASLVSPVEKLVDHILMLTESEERDLTASDPRPKPAVHFDHQVTLYINANNKLTCKNGRIIKKKCNDFVRYLTCKSNTGFRFHCMTCLVNKDVAKMC